jgi:hypothetical protein
MTWLLVFMVSAIWLWPYRQLPAVQQLAERLRTLPPL